MNSIPSVSHEEPKEIKLPASKSIGARYLMAACLGGVIGKCQPLDDCDDLRVIQSALNAIAMDNDKSKPLVIDVHASGTAFRFVTALAASRPGKYLITGTPRLCSRPMGPLLKVLTQAGARIFPQGADGRGPYLVEGSQLEGGEFEIAGNISSQFISALMLVAPYWRKGLRLKFTTPLVSRPYAEMTAGMMRGFGVDATLGENGVTVNPGNYRVPDDYKVEADWSAAGFFYEAALIGGHAKMRLKGLRPPGESLQGDAATASLFRDLGVISHFDSEGCIVESGPGTPNEIVRDMTDMPDLVPALCVGCVERGISFRLTGVANLRVKESDRLAVLQQEMGRQGYELQAGADTLEWEKGWRIPGLEATEPPVYDTHDDHRIAMSLAMMVFRRGIVRMHHPEVVEKSFERFWEVLGSLGVSCHKEGDILTLTYPLH